MVFQKFGFLQAAPVSYKRNFADKRSRRPIVQNPATAAPAALRVSAITRPWPPQPKITIGSLPEDDIIYIVGTALTHLHWRDTAKSILNPVNLE
jgi:hypothetical protein